jgi:hypothetical protein
LSQQIAGNAPRSEYGLALTKDFIAIEVRRSNGGFPASLLFGRKLPSDLLRFSFCHHSNFVGS